MGRLVNAGFLDVIRTSDGRRANRYRLTTDALQAMGVASPEELRATLAPLLDAGGVPEGAETAERHMRVRPTP